jgi:hypothetical protein
MLGHASVAFTLATYGRVHAEMRKPARYAMERLFGGTFAQLGASGKIQGGSLGANPPACWQVGQESNPQPVVL